MILRKLYIILLTFSLLCCSETHENYNFKIVLKKIDDENLKVNITFYGPLDFFWDSNILSYEYYKEDENNIDFFDINGLPLKRSQIILENRKGEMKFFSDIPYGIPFKIDNHYSPILPKKRILLDIKETEQLSFILPYSIEHFSFNKASIGEDIRLHYVYVPSSLKSNRKLKNSILTSNWIKFKTR